MFARQYDYAPLDTGPHPWQMDKGWVLPLFCTAGAAKPEDARYDPERAARPLKFFAELKHTKGPLTGLPFVLTGEQQWLIEEAFGWVVPRTGIETPDPAVSEHWRRLYSTVYVEQGRGNGKSQIGAGVGGYLLFADGEAEPEIVGVASDRKQARIVLDRLKAMVKVSDRIKKNAKPLMREIRNVGRGVSSGGWYEAASADVANSWGGHPHGIIFDEVHAQPHRDLWDALATGMGKRLQPMHWGLTTAGHDKLSLCYELHEQVRKIGNGTMQDPTFLGIVWAAAEDEDWTDPEVWQAANPLMEGPALDGRTPSGALCAITRKFMADQCQKAVNSPRFQNTFRTMYLSQWVGSETAFIPMRKWDENDETPDLTDVECYGALDLASVTDLAAFSMVGMRDGKVDIECMMWAPEEGLRERAHRDKVPYEVWARDGFITLTPGPTIDQDAIKAYVLEKKASHNLKDVNYDRWNAGKLVQELTNEGVKMEPVGQGFASMSSPTKQFEKHVLQGLVRHGHNPVLRWMLDCTTVVTDSAENVKPDKSKSTGRIDGIVATIMAFDGLFRRGMRRKSRW